MRAGLSTIQQTLTPEAATVLSQSIAEASRRNHGQTTPLHVAATLLASPSGYLRQACIRSHPNSSHPLQCRALDLCFSVALERLPTTQTSPPPGVEPPVSNALMAALKRAQANQRRGCPEQQQQPLLAVKVELDQLIISILDDPSVSRVMREASFSSPAVKAAIENSMNSSAAHNQHQPQGNLNFGSIGSRILSIPGQLTTPLMQSSSPVFPNWNAYLNPRLNQGVAGKSENQREDEVKKVLKIMTRIKKRNPVLVGDSEPVVVVKDVLRRLENKEFGGSGILKNGQVVSMKKGHVRDKNWVQEEIKELEGAIRSRIGSGAVILDLGDLNWLVEQPVSGGAREAVSEAGKAIVVEMAKLLARFRGDGGDLDNKLWLIGTASCETYLRCQIYHSTMENDWDLQAIPMASRSPLPGMFPRLGNERCLSNPVGPLNPIPLTKPVSENLDPGERAAFCPQCSENYQKELAKLTSIEKSFSKAQQGSSQPSLPQWLQDVKLNNATSGNEDQSHEEDWGLLSKPKAQELQKKWRDTCLHFHPNFHQSNRSGALATPTSLCDLKLLTRPMFPPVFQPSKPLGQALQLNTSQVTSQPTVLAASPLGSPVRTDLVLGRKGTESTPKKDFLGCISSEPQSKLPDKFANALDADTYKKLLSGLMEKAWWQAEAASAVASAITRCRLGNVRRSGAGSRADIWLLFTGPDRIGKRKMALVLAEQMCGASPIMIRLGTRSDDEESDVNVRGKTAIDRIAEAVQRNPFSVFMLEDIDEADVLVKGSVKCAIERGRLADFHGREFGLGNAILILTGDWSMSHPEALENIHFVDEKKLASSSSRKWKLGLIARERIAKRRASWLHDDDDDRSSKPRKEPGYSLSLNLNIAAGDDNDKTDGSHDSSDLTIDHEDELSLVNNHLVMSVPNDLLNNVDESIMFKPVNSAFVHREIKKTITSTFLTIMDEEVSLEVEDDALEKILGGLWHDRTSLGEWIQNILAPSFDRLKAQLPSGDRRRVVVRLFVEPGSGGSRRGNEDWLPSSISV